MNKQIQNDFVKAVEDVYTTLFTDGLTDGINLYVLDESTEKGFYQESKVKKYKKPVLLVAKVKNKAEKRKEDTAEADTNNLPKFTVSLKSMSDNNIPCYSEKDWDMLKRCYVEFHGYFYEVKQVIPSTFVGDVFATITLECTYNSQIKSLSVVESEGD